MSTEYLAECLWPGVTDADVAALDARARAQSSSAVRYVGATLVPEDEVVFCFYEGPSLDAVRQAAEAAEIPFERVLESRRISKSRPR